MYTDSLKMHYTVSANQKTSFEKQGAVLLPGLVRADQLAALRIAADGALGKSGNYFHRLRVWQDDPVLEDYCLRSEAPGVVAQLLDSDRVNLFFDQVFTREPGMNTATPWHNDQPYWPIRGTGVVTLWIALDDIFEDNAPLELIAGSHKWDRWFQPFIVADDGSAARNYPGRETNFEPLPDFDAERNRHEILCWEMQAGDAIAFHGLTVHGARGNTSPTRRRRGYAIRYTGDDVTYHDGPVMNPRVTNPALMHGDPLDSELYPRAELQLRR